MSDTIRSNRDRRTTSRNRLSGQSPVAASESLRFWREVTDGLGNRLQWPSLDASRLGIVNNPMSWLRRFLIALRGSGVTKERALHIHVWMGRQIDCLWPLDQTPLSVLRERAMRAESEDDIRELRCALEKNAITVREEITSKSAKVVADMRLLAELERELEAL